MPIIYGYHAGIYFLLPCIPCIPFRKGKNMLKVEEFTELLIENNLTNMVGVPDSTFKEWISYIGTASGLNHFVAVNECEATAIGAGQYLASGKPSVVYMQNDGFGKVVNPYTSLCAKDVFSIPMLFLVGWRGEPGQGDAAQHVLMGRIMTKLFDVMEIPYDVLTGDIAEDTIKVETAVSYMKKEMTPYALVLCKGLFIAAENSSENIVDDRLAVDGLLSRERLIELILDNTEDDALFVSTTGKASRELFELRKARNNSERQDFYNIGAMGCASSIAFGVASCGGDKPVYIIDGDGAVLMQMGALATVGHYGLSNLKHIIIDNNAHDSTGGQPNSSNTVDFAGVAKACGYKSVQVADGEADVVGKIKELAVIDGPALLVLPSCCGARDDLGRPDVALSELKFTFMNNF